LLAQAGVIHRGDSVRRPASPEAVSFGETHSTKCKGDRHDEE
jgi:hypothetical protein